MEKNDIIQDICQEVLKKYDREKIKIWPLAPENLNTKESKVYERCLENAFHDSRIRNIAVSGSYGIGKSSIIHTFEQKSAQKFLYISLMDYKKSEEQCKHKIEITLLRQILSHCFKNKFPRVRFGIVPEESHFINLKSFLIAIYVFILLSTMFSQWVADFLHFIKIDLHGYGTPLLHMTFIITSCIIVFCIIGYGLKYLKTKEITLKLSKENTEAGISFWEESVLDEYRFDLIYVLEKLSEDYDAIVFEDMDRLDSETCISVFHQLREINLGLNDRKKVKHFPFRFVYVVNDALMEKINQTKFFDYIMSVIPSLGNENARDKFQHFVLDDLGISLNGEEEKCIFDAVDTSKQLKDYRTLKQIKNDYTLFSKVVETTGVTINRNQGLLIGFVIYKVLWPQDYHLIRSGESFVFPDWIERGREQWKRLNKDDADKDPHREYQAIEKLKTILMNKECLKFIGYSKEERIQYYREVLEKGTAKQKEDLLNADTDFICGEILFHECSDTITEKYIKEIEEQFLLYFIRFYAEYPNKQENYDLFVENLKYNGDSIADSFVEKLKQEIEKSTEKVATCIFAIRFFLKRGYIKTDTNCSAYRWLLAEKIRGEDTSNLKKCMQILGKLLEEGRVDEKDVEKMFSAFEEIDKRVIKMYLPEGVVDVMRKK